MPDPVLNVADLVLEPWPPGAVLSGSAGERYAATMAQIGPRLGARKLGCNLTAVPPGKSAFPLHHHHANEELFFVLDGSGELQVGSKRHPIRAGDLIACPPGGPESAHKITNTGSAELRYLAVSTKIMPEVVGFPDSGKFGVLSEEPGPAPQRFTFVGRAGQGLGYWEGE